jgi:hypothetical protein
MADYGASIILSQKDKTSVSETDINNVREALGQIKNSGEFSDALGSDFLYKIIEISNAPDELLIILSEYWHGEGDDEENFGFAKENDEDEAQKIAEELNRTFNKIFDIKSEFGSW